MDKEEVVEVDFSWVKEMFVPPVKPPFVSRLKQPSVVVPKPRVVPKALPVSKPRASRLKAPSVVSKPLPVLKPSVDRTNKKRTRAQAEEPPVKKTKR
jgi:hypothetical protein